MKSKKLMAAVKKMRAALNLSQTELAERLGRSMGTIQRWENISAPRGQALAQLHRLAAESGQSELAELFKVALREDLSQEVKEAFEVVPVAAETYTPVAVPVTELEFLDTIFYLAGSDGFPQYKAALNKWYELTQALRYERANDVRVLKEGARAIRSQFENETKEKKKK